MSLNSNKIITYHFGIEITLTKTVKARGYFLSTINKSAVSSIIIFFQEVYWTLIIHEVTLHFTSCTSLQSNNSQSQVLQLIFTLCSKKYMYNGATFKRLFYLKKTHL